MPSYTLTEHMVKHTSTVPATEGVEMELPVREYDGTPGNGHAHDREPVLMLHGRSVPELAGFGLAPVPGGDPNRYSWAQEPAAAHYDVFLVDLQGSGRSPPPGADGRSVQHQPGAAATGSRRPHDPGARPSPVQVRAGQLGE